MATQEHKKAALFRRVLFCFRLSVLVFAKKVLVPFRQDAGSESVESSSCRTVRMLFALLVAFHHLIELLPQFVDQLSQLSDLPSERFVMVIERKE